jgi:hypothetical protein
MLFRSDWINKGDDFYCGSLQMISSINAQALRSAAWQTSLIKTMCNVV